MNFKHVRELVDNALAIEYEDAKEAGQLAFMARSLVQATMPHSPVATNEFIRSNGDFSMSMLAPSDVGLPYGSIPRLLMAWITTEAARTKTPELKLGSNLSQFMEDVGLGQVTGGRWGSITRFRDQINRLFRCYISCSYSGLHPSGKFQIDMCKNVLIAHKFDLWWNVKNPNQELLWQSTVKLNQEFFEEIITSPVPVDLRALKALSKSPMSLDIYLMLTRRMSYLRKEAHIPWEAMRLQIGAGYQDTKQGRKDFKTNFVKGLKRVQIIYPEAKVAVSSKAFILRPSPTHVPLIA